MLNKSNLTAARKLAELVSEATTIADCLANDLNIESQDPKNKRIEEALDDLAYEIYEIKVSLAEMDHQLDNLIRPYDKELAS